MAPVAPLCHVLDGFRRLERYPAGNYIERRVSDFEV